MVYRPLRYEQMMRAAEPTMCVPEECSAEWESTRAKKCSPSSIGEDIGLKLSPDHLCEALKLPGAGPMRPDKDAEPMREYVRMPREVLDNLDQFVFWVGRSADYARRKLPNAS